MKAIKVCVALMTGAVFILLISLRADQVGAAGTALVPARIEHEVIHDQLPPPFEQVDQACPAAGPVEICRALGDIRSFPYAQRT